MTSTEATIARDTIAISTRMAGPCCHASRRRQGPPDERSSDEGGSPRQLACVSAGSQNVQPRQSCSLTIRGRSSIRTHSARVQLLTRRNSDPFRNRIQRQLNGAGRPLRPAIMPTSPVTKVQCVYRFLSVCFSNDLLVEAIEVTGVRGLHAPSAPTTTPTTRTFPHPREMFPCSRSVTGRSLSGCRRGEAACRETNRRARGAVPAERMPVR
jgi:hypothetical protein